MSDDSLKLLEDDHDPSAPAKGDLSAFDKLKSLAHLGSTKPFWVTMRDGLIVAVITVLVVMLIMFAYYWYVGNLAYMKTSKYLISVGRCLAKAITAQLLYENQGVNAMLCESAIRYGTGSSLAKFKSRRHALAYEVSYKLLEEHAGKPESEALMKENFKRLKAVVDCITELHRITKYCRNEMKKGRKLEDISDKEIYNYINKRKKNIKNGEVTTLRKLVPDLSLEENLDYLETIGSLVDVLDEDIVRYILANGFKDFKPIKGGILGDTLVLSPLGRLNAYKLGKERMEKLLNSNTLNEDEIYEIDERLKYVNEQIPKLEKSNSKLSLRSGTPISSLPAFV